MGGPSKRSSAPSRQAQVGALALQMFAVGLIDDGSSSVPKRTTVRPARPVESEKSCVPHLAQKRRVTVFPLSAVFSCWLGVPAISIDALGKIAFTVPLDEMRWQSLHQQILDGPGSAVIRYRI